MNRRNLLKSLFALPFIGLLKAIPLRGLTANQKTQRGVNNTSLDNLALNSHPVYVRATKAAAYKQYYNLAEDGTIKELSHTDYMVYRDCSHSEWVTSPAVSDPAGIIAETYSTTGTAPSWPGKCLKCVIREKEL